MKNSLEIRRHFASDNYAGICPEAWAALTEANRDHAVSYGDDSWTARAADLIREVFETSCEVFFVFNGNNSMLSVFVIEKFTVQPWQLALLFMQSRR